MLNLFKKREQLQAPADAAAAGNEEAPASEPTQDDGVEILGDGRAQIRLKWPVKLGNKLIDEITLRRPRAEDMKRLSTTDRRKMKPYESVQYLAQLIEGQPTVFADKLDLEDLVRIGEVMQRFFPGGPLTGPED